MALKYQALKKEIEEKILTDRKNGVVNPYRCHDENVIRRNTERDQPTLVRPAFVRDIEKILHLPSYNRYNDKTQVFSFYQNDDISRRGLHVQLVSRIARNIGGLLGLNTELIEAIALGHDMGHTPFGHAGERFLNEIYHKETGRYFFHNVHSVRTLDKLYRRNLSLQTLDGILCHNGEFEMKEYRPCQLNGFQEFDKKVERCYVEGDGAIKSLIPSTLEGCVVRVSDMIAYLGKDRQDAVLAKIIPNEEIFTGGQGIGAANAEIINNLIVNIVENSYGKDYIRLSEREFTELKQAKKENYDLIYNNPEVNALFERTVRPMIEETYYALREDVEKRRETSFVFTHHIDYIEKNRAHYKGGEDYRNADPNDISVDYIAAMTDDYFIELHKKLFPDSPHKIEYHSYFD